MKAKHDLSEVPLSTLVKKIIVSGVEQRYAVQHPWSEKHAATEGGQPKFVITYGMMEYR